jgi:hypothetical protein
MFGGSLVNGGDGGDPDAPLLPHAAALISACHIELQVPPTAKRAKHVVRRCYPPLRALSGLYCLNLTVFELQLNSAVFSPLDGPFFERFF